MSSIASAPGELERQKRARRGQNEIAPSTEEDSPRTPTTKTPLLRTRSVAPVITTPKHVIMIPKRVITMSETRTLDIPHERYTQVAMLPVAYTLGTAFRPRYRKPVAEVSSWNCFTRE
jgi:hypothetical protein